VPFYAFKCDKCDNSYEEFRAMGDFPKKCPRCETKYNAGFHQDYSKSNVTGVTYGNPTTVGQQAEINTRKLGKEQMQLMEESDKKRRSGFKGPSPRNGKPVEIENNYIPPWRDGCWGLPKEEKPIDITKIPNLEKYVATGIK
jgi:putative FmdB family regulatory protein